MSDSLSDQQTLIFVKEGTYGVDAVDAAFTANDDVVYLQANAEADIVPMGDPFTPGRARSSQSGVESTFIERGSEVTIPVPMVGGNSADNYALPYSDILEAAGFKVSTEGSTTEYALATAQLASGTLYQYLRRAQSDSHRLRRARGVRLNINVQGTVGEEVVMTAAGQGIGYHDYTAAREYFDADGDPALDAAGTSLTYTGSASRMSDERLVCKGMAATWNSIDLPLVSFDIDYAMTITLREEATSDPTGASVNRTRDGVSPATGTITITTRDGGTAYEAIQAAVAANTVANLVLTWSGSATEIVSTHRVQWTQTPEKQIDAGLVGFQCSFEVRGDFDTHPFGDNGVKWVSQAVS